MNTLWFLWHLPQNAAIMFLIGYRKIISPLYGDVCRFHPTCSHYSLTAFREYGFVRGTQLTLWRLVRCQPFSRGGVEHVTPNTYKNFTLNDHGFAVHVTASTKGTV